MARPRFPLINGSEPGFSSINLNILGSTVVGITGIKYEMKQEKSNEYGLGELPVSRSYGVKEPSGSITLLGSAVEALRASISNGDLTDIPPFDIPVIWTPKNSTEVRVHVLKACEFTGDSVDIKTKDQKYEVELSLVIGDINYNA